MSGSGSYEPFTEAVTDNQKQSLAELPLMKRYALYEQVSPENLSIYHQVSCRPITKKAEDNMELLSDIVTWGERYCSRCRLPLCSSIDKWDGPCVWPSFRGEIVESNRNSTSYGHLTKYNQYPESTVIKEVYCVGCDLFLGHAFDDGVEKGDHHPNAHWRH